jgi:hypothetical protein
MQDHACLSLETQRTQEALQDRISEYNITMGHKKVPRPHPLLRPPSGAEPPSRITS